MNAALAVLIVFLRADVQTETDIAKLCRLASGLQTVGVNTTSVALAGLAASARSLIRSMGFVDREALPSLRMALLALSDAMEQQAAKTLPPTPAPAAPESRDETLPYWNRN